MMGMVIAPNYVGYKVKIPSIFISHENGEKLAALAQKSEKKIVLKIHFENTKSKKVNVTFYLQSSNLVVMLSQPHVLSYC